ncbi:MAG: putative phage-associated protein [Candidatus Saccharibacteria bacterium]|nr:putative phage-associated protein [Candidatus Saccharibacteria bacterium]
MAASRLRAYYAHIFYKLCRKSQSLCQLVHSYFAYAVERLRRLMLAIRRKEDKDVGEKSMNSISAYDVANVFAKLTDIDSGEVLTNLKIQKLVYYAQGFHLAMFDKPLFNDPIVAWEHGPVVEDLYHKLKEHKSSPVMIAGAINKDISTEQIELLVEVYDVYGQFSAWKLRDMTHNETPWATTPKGYVITHAKLKTYFKNQLQ